MVHLTLQEKKVLFFLLFLFAAGLAVGAFRSSTGCNFCLVDIYSGKKDVAALDLNTAGKEALVALPGIGEKLASDIVVYRFEHGPFRNIEELTKVKGITAAKAARLKSYLFVR